MISVVFVVGWYVWPLLADSDRNDRADFSAFVQGEKQGELSGQRPDLNLNIGFSKLPDHQICIEFSRVDRQAEKIDLSWTG